MLDLPIRKRIKNYPKDFTPPSGYFDSKPQAQSEPIVTQTSYIRTNNFSRPRFNPHSLTTSTQLLQKQIDNQRQQNNIKSNFTLNPQQHINRVARMDTENDSPLLNLHIGRKTMYINPDLLLKPRIQDNQNLQLIQKQDQQLQESSPGIIKKNSYQKPLSQQKPTIVIIPNRQSFTSKKLQRNQNNFYQSVKSQYSNFNNLKSKRLPSFLQNDISQPSGSFKLSKRQSESLMQSHLQTTKDKSQQKKKLIDFGFLLQQKQVDKLKAHINQLALTKSKNKQKLAQTYQTQANLQPNNYPKFSYNKIRPRTNFFPNQNMLQMQYPELGQRSSRIYRINQTANTLNNEKFQPYQSNSRAYSTPKNTMSLKKITISYKKTSLSNLNQIYNQLSNIQSASIQVQIPNILLNLSFQPNLQKSQLYTRALIIFQNLGLPTQNMSVKRYSNCIMMLSKNICIIWHNDGKIYLGSWQIKYLDQGFKHGLGLQWVPGKYIYYGQFVQSKKQGLGIMKTRNQCYLGQWIQNKRNNNGYIINKNGEIYNTRNSHNNHYHNNYSHRLDNNYSYRLENNEQRNDRDPFM